MVYRGGVAKPDETRRSAEHRRSRLEFETLISDLSSRFINLPGDEVDGAIKDGLRRVCASLGIDYAVLWQWSASAPAVLLPTHAYPEQEGQQAPENLSVEQFPWCLQQMVAGRTVVFSSLGELPPEAAVDRASCRRHGVKSNLTVPLSVGAASRVGVLGFNTTRAERDWPGSQVQRLQLVAQVFTNALARKRADEALRESEERLALAADSAEAGLWTLDYGTGVFWATDRARALFGFSPDEVITLERFQASVHPEDWGLVREAMARSARAGEPIDVDYRIILPGDGRVTWMTSRGRPRHKPTGEPESLTGVSIDVSARIDAQEALRDLSQRLIGAHEGERALLARELHDDVSQRLAVLAIDVGRAELAAPDAAQAQAMQEVRAGLVRLSEDIHSLAYQLHPSVLEELGLVEALRAECERRGRQGQLDLSVDLESLTAVIGKDAALCLFRVAQEALNNVARHAGVHTATVTLRQMDGGLLLAVSDDGTGFDPVSPDKGMHLGLASMRERVRLVHGTLDIESAPGRGTTILAWVPAEEAS